MSIKKNLIQLIGSTEKKEFDLVIKAYLKFEFGYEKVIITDGKDDGGLDIRVFDFNQQKIQYQLTTQKSNTTSEKYKFKNKLYEDISKAELNHNEFGYSNKLIFFYSYPMTNVAIREYEKYAFKECSVNLELIEANRLAEEAENIIEIQRILYKICELDKFEISDSLFENKNENLVFDLLSFGKPSEFKMQIVEAFILKLIFNKETITKEEIISHCEIKFDVSENDIFYDKLLGKLMTSKKIRKSFDKQNYLICDKYINIVNTKIEQHELDEKVFVRDTLNILSEFKQEEYLEDYIIELKSIYVDNFKSDLKSIVERENNDSLNTIFKEFINFIRNKKVPETHCVDLAKDLLNNCLNSKFIQKIAASKIYCENINNSRLQNYLTTQKKIFIDTPIALHALCYYYKPNNEYSYYYYRIIKNLIDFVQREKISLYLSDRYILEIGSHVREAFYLIPFTQIENFEKLGGSRNVFYNFYLYLKKSESIDDDITFSRFLREFGFFEGVSKNSLNSQIKSHLENIGIFDFAFDYNYDLDEINRIFDSKLNERNRTKSKFTKNNDSIMVKFLAHDDIEVHPLKPVFITWDKIIYEVQEEFMQKFPDSQDWLMISPSKLIDAYGILKFSIDSETVTENLLALMSDELVTNTHSLIDTIKFILNTDNEVGLEYTNKLARIREEEINKINANTINPPANMESETVIDDVMFNLTNYFREDDDQSKFERFKLIFTKKELMEDVLVNIEKTIIEFYETKEIKKDFYKYFDNLTIHINSEN